MVYRKEYNSPLGKIWMQSDGENLTGLWFDNSRDMAKHKTTFEAENLPIFDETTKWLDVYFAGNVPDFTPKYRIENATPFRNRVIEIISTIPYGETITYNDIAKQIAGYNAKNIPYERGDLSHQSSHISYCHGGYKEQYCYSINKCHRSKFAISIQNY